MEKGQKDENKSLKRGLLWHPFSAVFDLVWFRTTKLCVSSIVSQSSAIILPNAVESVEKRDEKFES